MGSSQRGGDAAKGGETFVRSGEFPRDGRGEITPQKYKIASGNAHGINGRTGRTLGIEAGMRTGKDIILATRPYAVDFPAKSWAYVLSTAFLLALFGIAMAALAGRRVFRAWPAMPAHE